MPSFLEGFANKLGGTLDEFTQNKLKMAMMSKQMEMEAQNRMAEMQKQYELNMVPGEQIGGLLKGMGASNDMSGLNGQMFPGGLAQSAVQGYGSGMRIPGFANVDAGVDSNGNKLTRVFNKKTGQFENQATLTGGMSGTAAEDVSKVRQASEEMRGVINLVDQQVKKLTVASGAMGLPAQAAQNKIAQYLQNDSGAMKAYTDTIASHNQRFEYMLSHNPRIPHEIVQQAAGQWFNPTSDIGPTWEQKKQNLLNLIDNSERAGLAAHGLAPLKDNAKHYSEGVQAGQQSATDLAKQNYLNQLNTQFGEQQPKSKGK